jgi:hypothetical protein
MAIVLRGRKVAENRTTGRLGGRLIFSEFSRARSFGGLRFGVAWRGVEVAFHVVFLIVIYYAGLLPLDATLRTCFFFP